MPSPTSAAMSWSRRRRTFVAEMQIGSIVFTEPVILFEQFRMAGAALSLVSGPTEEQLRIFDFVSLRSR